MVTAAEQLDREVRCVMCALLTLAGGDAQDLPLEQMAESIGARLAGADDRRVCTDVMSLLWPDAAPEDCGHSAWWATPLGRWCARTLDAPDRPVTYATAAGMLGVARGTVSVMVSRGTLGRHPAGGVSRASVLHRLARL